MESLYKTLAAHSNWWPDNAHTSSKIGTELASLIFEKGSLTAALMALSNNNFEVNVVEQEFTLPYFHEQKALNRPLSLAAMIREVELQLYGETVVFARSIIPLLLIKKGLNGLASLGQTPLGHLLFQDGKMRVSKREFTQLNVRQLDENKTTVTARRTPYDYQGSQILVSEFFLPALSKYL